MAVQAIEMQKRLDLWEASEGLPPMQKFPPHILNHLSMYVSAEELFWKARNLSKNQ